MKVINKIYLGVEGEAIPFRIDTESVQSGGIPLNVQINDIYSKLPGAELTEDPVRVFEEALHA